MKKRRTYQHCLVYWYDIEEASGWGEGNDEPPVCVTSGFLIKRPGKRDKIPSYKVASTFVEGEVGSVHIYPEAIVKEIVLLDRVNVPYRK